MSTGCGAAPQQALGTQILVNVRPMNSVAAACRSPILALFGRGGQKPRIPGERHDYAAPIHQVSGHALIIDVNPANPDVRRNLNHSTPPPPAAAARAASAAPVSGLRRSRRGGGAG